MQPLMSVSNDPSGTAVRTPARLLRATALVALLLLGGTVGYRYVEGADWWEAFYMTVITITTVGFNEVFPLSMPGQLLTVLLLVSGLGIFFFLASEIGRSVMEAELRHYLGRVRRSRMMERMTGHDIVCGYGRMGKAVVEELQRAGRQVVVVDSCADRLRGQRLRGRRGGSNVACRPLTTGPSALISDPPFVGPRVPALQAYKDWTY